MKSPDPDFAPVNPTDGRELLEWKSKYSDFPARRGIYCEALYLAALFFGVPIVILAVWLGYPNHWLGLPNPKYRILFRYAVAWLGGTFGGTLFDIKWLYHSVAKQLWHLDRRLWRLFIPHISGGLACAVVALISSGLLRIFDQHATESGTLVFGISFLVGYFSDSTIAKLAEVAGTLFGPIQGHEKEVSRPSPPTEREGSGG